MSKFKDNINALSVNLNECLADAEKIDRLDNVSSCKDLTIELRNISEKLDILRGELRARRKEIIADRRAYNILNPNPNRKGFQQPK